MNKGIKKGNPPKKAGPAAKVRRIMVRTSLVGWYVTEDHEALCYCTFRETALRIADALKKARAK